MRYRIKETTLNDMEGEVLIQCKGSWGSWHDVWRRKFALVDREYALTCAEELFDNLTAEI